LAIAKSGSHIISIVSRFVIPPRSNSATGKRRHQRRGHPPRGRDGQAAYLRIGRKQGRSLPLDTAQHL